MSTNHSLIWSAMRGKIGVILLPAMKYELDVNASTSGGWTALHWAAKDGQVDATRILIDLGAEVDATNWVDWTPLHMAAANGKGGVVKFLVSEHKAKS